MQTLLTITQQKQFLANNRHLKTWIHKWSTRGYGNSKILDSRDNVIGKAGGCGYDRYGAALGEAISSTFPKEIAKLAKRECQGKRRDYKQAKKFYGLFYNSTKKQAWLDGGCGSQCMIKILNKIGFSLNFVGDQEGNKSGMQFYTLSPIDSHDREMLKY